MADQVVDADQATDDEIANALFGGDSENKTDEDSTKETDTATDEQDNEGQEPETVEDLPEWAQAEIRKLRREAAQARVKAREQRGKTETKPAGDDKDVTAAEERGRKAARLEFGMELADAKVRSALTGIVAEDKMDDVVDDLNLSRLVDDEGKVDDDAVAALKDRYTALLGTTRTRKPRPQAAASGGAPKKKTSEELFVETFTGLL